MNNVKLNKFFNKFINSKFIKFSITGFLRTITNLLIFYILCDISGLSSNVSAIMTFLIAVTQNYIINHFWTFNEINKSKKLSFIGYLKFILVSSIGLAINLAVLNLILYFFDLPLKVIAQAFGILAGLIFNFIGSKIFVFNKTSNS